jgi:hypothetical protein
VRYDYAGPSVGVCIFVLSARAAADSGTATVYLDPLCITIVYLCVIATLGQNFSPVAFDLL